MRSALAALLALGVAHADPLPDGLRFQTGEGREHATLYVVRGKDRGRVPVPEQSGVSAVKHVGFDRKAALVTLDYADGCEDARELSWPLGVLQARLENSVAFRQLEGGKLDVAIRGFRKAIVLDGKLDVARTNLASALVRAGDRASALAALQPLLDSAPVATYGKIAGDKDLAPLLDAPSVAHVRAPQRGTAVVPAKGVTSFVAATSELIALVRAESGWASGCTETLDVELRRFDGTLVAVLPLGGERMVNGSPASDRDECVALPSRGAHVAAANRVLADLGFAPAAFEAGKLSRSKGGDPNVVFARSKLGIVAAGRATRALSGDRVVATAPELDGNLESGLLLLAQHVVVLGWVQSAREGCESFDLTGFQLLRLP